MINVILYYEQRWESFGRKELKKERVRGKAIKKVCTTKIPKQKTFCTESQNRKKLQVFRFGLSFPAAFSLFASLFSSHLHSLSFSLSVFFSLSLSLSHSSWNLSLSFFLNAQHSESSPSIWAESGEVARALLYSNNQANIVSLVTPTFCGCNVVVFFFLWLLWRSLICMLDVGTVHFFWLLLCNSRTHKTTNISTPWKLHANFQNPKQI